MAPALGVVDLFRQQGSKQLSKSKGYHLTALKQIKVETRALAQQPVRWVPHSRPNVLNLFKNNTDEGIVNNLIAKQQPQSTFLGNVSASKT